MSDSKRYSTLVNNTILFAISNFGSKIISLIIQPYLSYALASPDVMGVTSLMQSVANLLIPVVSLGVSFAVIRFGLDRKVDKSSVFMNGLATILLGFALMAVCWPLVRLIPNAADYLVLIYACVLMSCLRTLCTQFIRSRMLNRLVAVDGVLIPPRCLASIICSWMCWIWARTATCLPWPVRMRFRQSLFLLPGTATSISVSKSSTKPFGRTCCVIASP